MKEWWKRFGSRDLFIALFAAAVGALMSYFIPIWAAPTSKLSIKVTRLETQITDEAQREENGKPLATVQHFAIKNTGSRPLRNLSLEFAPAGGDSAYDPQIKQILYISSRNDIARSGRAGARISRRANVILVNYELFKVGDIDGLTITNDGLGDTYDISSNDPDLEIDEQQVQTSFPFEFSELKLQAFSLTTLIFVSLGTAAATLMIAGAVYLFGRRQKND